MRIPIIFNVEAVNSQNEGFVRAARRGGVRPCNYSWKADREKLPRHSWERAPVEPGRTAMRPETLPDARRAAAGLGAVIPGLNP